MLIGTGRDAGRGLLKPEGCNPKPPHRADDGLRTRDLQLGKLALYQLSYVRVDEHSTMRHVALPLGRETMRRVRTTFAGRQCGKACSAGVS